MSKYVSYEQSGVSIDGGDKIAQRIHSYISRTYDPRVISIADGFAGLFRLDYKETLLKFFFSSVKYIALNIYELHVDC